MNLARYFWFLGKTAGAATATITGAETGYVQTTAATLAVGVAIAGAETGKIQTTAATLAVASHIAGTETGKIQTTVSSLAVAVAASSAETGKMATGTATLAVGVQIAGADTGPVQTTSAAIATPLSLAGAETGPIQTTAATITVAVHIAGADTGPVQTSAATLSHYAGTHTCSIDQTGPLSSESAILTVSIELAGSQTGIRSSDSARLRVFGVIGGDRTIAGSEFGSISIDAGVLMSWFERLSIRERIELKICNVLADIPGIGNIYRFDPRGKIELGNLDAFVAVTSDTKTDESIGYANVIQRRLIVETLLCIRQDENDVAYGVHLYNVWHANLERALAADDVLVEVVDGTSTRLAVISILEDIPQPELETGQREVYVALRLYVDYQHDRLNPCTLGTAIPERLVTTIPPYGVHPGVAAPRPSAAYLKGIGTTFSLFVFFDRAITLAGTSSRTEFVAHSTASAYVLDAVEPISEGNVLVAIMAEGAPVPAGEFVSYVPSGTLTLTGLDGSPVAAFAAFPLS